MKSTFMAAAIGLLALFNYSSPAQSNYQKAGGIFKIRTNVLFNDASELGRGDIRAEELKLSEDGSEQKITSLTLNTAPLHLQIIIDSSGSMASQKDPVVAISKLIIQDLSSDSQAQIIRFGGLGGIETLNEWTPDKAWLEKIIDERVGGGGSSPIIDSVWTGLDQFKKLSDLPGDKRFAIVLISDCLEGGSSRKQDQLFEELAKADVPVFVVALTELFDRLRLPNLPNGIDKSPYQIAVERFAHNAALVSGGSVYFPRKGTNAKLPLAESLKVLLAELRSDYVLTYTPSNQDRDDKERNLKIEFADNSDGRKRAAIIKPVYVVPALK